MEEQNIYFKVSNLSLVGNITQSLFRFRKVREGICVNILQQ